MADVVEELRILYAARDGRLSVNDSGRWVIDGQVRPDPKVRKRLQARRWIHRKGWSQVVLMSEGAAALALLEGSGTDGR